MNFPPNFRTRPGVMNVKPPRLWLWPREVAELRARLAQAEANSTVRDAILAGRAERKAQVDNVVREALKAAEAAILFHHDRGNRYATSINALAEVRAALKELDL